MKNNQFFMPLNIQLFAEEEGNMGTTPENVEKEQGTTSEEPVKKEKFYSRDELNKIVSTEKEKLRAELRQEAEVKKTEAEKLAKMDEDQKTKYELEQTKKELKQALGQVNSLTLKTEATSYASEKGLPVGYIEDLDFSKETAESIKGRIDKLTDLRSKDLSNYLNSKLKQNSPKAVEDKKDSTDPFIQGYKDYMKNR